MLQEVFAKELVLVKLDEQLHERFPVASTEVGDWESGHVEVLARLLKLLVVVVSAAVPLSTTRRMVELGPSNPKTPACLADVNNAARQRVRGAAGDTLEVRYDVDTGRLGVLVVHAVIPPHPWTEPGAHCSANHSSCRRPKLQEVCHFTPPGFESPERCLRTRERSRRQLSGIPQMAPPNRR